MAFSSTGVLSENNEARARLSAPFSVYGKLIQSASLPFAGNRWEQWRAEQKIANLIELNIKNNFDLDRWDIAFPIKFTRQFGQNPRRIQIVGNYMYRRDEYTDGVADTTFPPKKIADDVDRINANELRNGQGSWNAADLKPVDSVNDFANTIRMAFSVDPFDDWFEVMTVEVFGIMYGRTGRHFSP